MDRTAPAGYQETRRTSRTAKLIRVALAALFTAGTTMVQYFAEDSQVAAVVFWTLSSNLFANLEGL